MTDDWDAITAERNKTFDDAPRDYWVVRTHSHTDKQMLWKVMSRPFEDAMDADNWRSFCKSQEKNKDHEFFVISKLREVK